MTVYLVYQDGPSYYQGAAFALVCSSLEKAKAYVERSLKGEVWEFKKTGPLTWENEHGDQYYIVERELE
jgi:hypothetical protein